MMISEPMPEISADVLFFHILPRLPGKSILRFHCVSTQWNSFLKTPMFADIHLHHDHDHHKKLLVFSTTTPLSFCTMDCETPEDGFNNTTTRPLPFKTTSTEDLVYVLSSLNGLLLIGIIPGKRCHRFSDTVLWNPLTGEFKILPRNEECYHASGFAFDLYYSSSDNDCKLIRVISTHNVHIYSLKSDSWTKVVLPTNSFRVMSRHCFFSGSKPCALLNEKFYAIKSVKGNYTSYPVTRFDLKTNKITEIAAPSFSLDDKRVRNPYVHLCVLRGCIYFCVYQMSRIHTETDFVREFEMWRMDGDDGDWIEVLSTYSLLSHFPEPIHLTKNGNWVMRDNYHVYKVDGEKHSEDKLCAIPAYHIHNGGIYMESFVSIN